MVTPLLLGIGIAGLAYIGKTAVRAVSQVKNANPGVFQQFKNTVNPNTLRNNPRLGFLPKMSRNEAAQILNIPENSPPEKIKQAHRLQMQLNHPDMGGSMFVATKINEAKDRLLSRTPDDT